MCTITKVVPRHWKPTSLEKRWANNFGGYCYLLVKQPRPNKGGTVLRPALLLQNARNVEDFMSCMAEVGILSLPIAVRFLDTEGDTMTQAWPTIELSQISQVEDDPAKILAMLLVEEV